MQLEQKGRRWPRMDCTKMFCLDSWAFLYSSVICVNAIQKKQLRLHTFAFLLLLSWASQSAHQLLCQLFSQHDNKEREAKQNIFGWHRCEIQSDLRSKLEICRESEQMRRIPIDVCRRGKKFYIPAPSAYSSFFSLPGTSRSGRGGSQIMWAM